MWFHANSAFVQDAINRGDLKNCRSRFLSRQILSIIFVLTSIPNRSQNKFGKSTYGKLNDNYLEVISW